MQFFYRLPPVLALVVVAAIAVTFDPLVAGIAGPDHTTITFYNRTTKALTFATGDARKVATYIPACTTIEFVVIGHVWHLNGQAASPSAGAPAAVPVDIEGLIPPFPDASGPSRWEIVVGPDRFDGGLSWPGNPTPPPCTGPPREPVAVAGDGNVTAGPYHLGGHYALALSVQVPEGSSCDFGATKKRVGGKFDSVLINDRILTQDPNYQDGRAFFEPGDYEVSVHSACGPWKVTLTPQAR